MRIARLDLIRYGHFTDRSIAFPRKGTDFHIIFGPNEAGKSTALQGLEDLLFGIPKNSPLNFLHAYKDMRLGALLEHEKDSIELRRRKGNTRTILTPDDAEFPQGEAKLNSFLGGADLELFIRMFFLNHIRLTEGGKEMLDAKDDAGQALFAAGAGLKDLRERLQSIESSATELFTARKNQARAFYQAEDRLNNAESKLRESSISSSEWQRRKQAFEAAESAFDGITHEVDNTEAELRRTNRIERVYPYVTAREKLDRELDEIGEVATLPEDSEHVLTECERQVAEQSTRIQTLSEILRDTTGSLANYEFDSTVIEHAADIQRLAEERIRIKAGRNDLPKRKLELEATENRLREIADTLGWPDGSIDDLITRIPPRSKVASVRELTSSKGSVDSSIAAAKVALNDAKRTVSTYQDRLNALPAARNAAALAAILKATAEHADIASRISAAREKHAAAEAKANLLHSTLNPSTDSEDALISLHPPPLDTVQTFRDKQRDAQKRCDDTNSEIARLQTALNRLESHRSRVLSESEVVPPEEIDRLRGYRNTGWQLIRGRYIHGTEVPDEELSGYLGGQEDLAKVFEDAIHAADKGADKRFERAEETAQLSVIDSQLDETRRDLGQARAELSLANEAIQKITDDWQNLWQSAPFDPQPPDFMMQWHQQRAELIEAIESRKATNAAIERLEQTEKTAASDLLKEMERLGVGVAALEASQFRIVFEAARSLEADIRAQAEERIALSQQLRDSEQLVAQKGLVLEENEATAERWESDWKSALSALGLDVTTKTVAVEAQLDAVEELRELSLKIKDLREERIQKIERDISQFADEVRSLASSVAPDLDQSDPDECVVGIARLYEEASRLREAYLEKQKLIAEQTKQLEEHKSKRQEAQDRIDSLLTLAKVSTNDELRSSIMKAKRRAEYANELSEVLDVLQRQGDGLDVDELTQDCKGIDLDIIRARSISLTEELKELRARAAEVRDSRTKARQEFESLGGTDAALRAESDRQSALAEMETIAEEYVRLRSVSLLLRWGIDRYQSEKATPMLRRAGELFNALTCSSFSGLDLSFDDQDRIRLIGTRPNGESVAVDGMSSGSRDQLYLALRISAIEEYERRGHSIPLAVDDLFINFDDERAASGFRVLAGLADNTQVLFFTHHSHLLEIAKSALPKQLSVTNL